MRWSRLTTMCVVLGLTAAVAWPQYSDQPLDGQRPQRKQAIPEAGFWPTQTMMERAIDRLTEAMGQGLGFDEDQLYNTREIWKGRLPQWLNDNRGAIQQLTNEYFEALLSRDAPDPATVARWSAQVLPLFQEFGDVLNGTMDEMRPFLTQEQQSMLDAQKGAMDMGVQSLSQRLEVWAGGGFDARTDWYRSEEFVPSEPGVPPPGVPGYAEGTEVVVNAEAAGPAPGAPRGPEGRAAAQAKDEWTQYVESFIRRYGLTEEQQAAAHKLLHSAQEQRDFYLRRNQARLVEAARKVQAATNDEQRATAEQGQAKLRQPVERMFQQLKDRLDQLPTRKQRLAAAQADLERGSGPKPAQATTSSADAGATSAGPKPP